MRPLLLFAFSFLLLVIGGCQKSTPLPELDGTYTGTFQREPGGQIAQVSLLFSGKEYSGTSQIRKYPALCTGTYEVTSDNKIKFTNDCIWTAEFDWTLILSGEYNLRVKGDTVEMVRQRGTERDIYRLRK